MIKHTESESYYNDLENMSTLELLTSINTEDQKIALAVQKQLHQIQPLVNEIVNCFQNGGKLFYIGAGTSGRLGILDASECPPTFGVPHDMVVGLIAGGDSAIRKAVENAEDNQQQAGQDLQNAGFQQGDVVIGIASSGTTPYVLGGINFAKQNGGVTGCIVCNELSPIAKAVDYPIEIIVGAEFVTGSTRMKSGTAQKMVLNMLTTSSMIKIGRVKGNRMIDMQLSNQKLVQRGVEMILLKADIDKQAATELLLQYGSVRNVLDHLNK